MLINQFFKNQTIQYVLINLSRGPFIHVTSTFTFDNLSVFLSRVLNAGLSLVIKYSYMNISIFVLLVTQRILSCSNNIAVWIPLLHSAGGLGNLPLILTLHPPGCWVAALMLLPCYHSHYSSRVAAPSAERGKQWFLSISTELLSGRNTNQHTERWEMHRESAC